MTHDRIRVLYLIDSLRGGGAENSLADVVVPLARRDVETTVVTLMPPDDDDVSARIRSGARIIDLSGLDWMRKLSAVDRLLRRHPHDLVHTTLFHADVTGRILSRFRSRPVVTTLANEAYTTEHRHSSARGPWTVCCAHAIDAGTARFASRFHAVSQSVASTMCERLRVPSARVEVVWRGRPADRLGRRSNARRLAVRRRLEIASDVPVLLCIARLDKQKGVDRVISAHRRLRAARSDALLLVAGGEGNDAKQVRRLAGDSESSGVRLLGQRSDVADLMCAADVLCIGSRWEGVGGVAIEAMALELPIVMPELPGLIEVTEHTAVRVSRPGDSAEMVAGLDEAITRGPAVARRVAAARQRFEDHFTIDAAADGMRALYERALPPGRGAGAVGR